MTSLVVREDLSRRTALSKSALASFEWCPTEHWFSLHDPRPFVTNEDVEFGSALDAAVEVCVKYASMEQPIDLNRAFAAAAEVIARHPELPTSIEEVRSATQAFVAEVMPRFDWKGARTQVSITTVIDGLGEANGHPDIVMADLTVLDVKSSNKTKTVPSIELGFYGLLVEADDDKHRQVPRVGYLNYVRLKKPVWYIDGIVPYTDELRRWAYENAAAYVRAKKADTILNAKAETPGNYSMTGGPKYASKCKTCVYSPAFDGPCLIAAREEVA